LVINDEYVPQPDHSEIAKLELLRLQEEETSSTSSSSEATSLDSKPTGYEKILKKMEKKKGKILKDDFSMISLIGTGSYGKVFLVRKNDNQKIYAMKVLKKSFIRKYK
jgi:hypothetical protein